MPRFYVHIADGPWWKEPHWGFTYDKAQAHVYDCSHATDRQHIEWGLKTFPGRIRLRQYLEPRYSCQFVDCEVHSQTQHGMKV